MNSEALQKNIVDLLLSIDNPLCIAEAKRVKALPTLKRRFHFRNLKLTASNLGDFFNLLDNEQDYNINSLSFSQNPIGNEGAQIIADRMPNYIEEIGLVECGIGDIGAKALLTRLGELSQLDMICIENNNLSDSLKLEYQKFGAFNPELIVIV